MARQLFIVLADNNNALMETGYARGHMIPEREGLSEVMGVFTHKPYADAYAKTLSAKNPGVEVYVFEQSYGFYNASNPKIITKTWNKEGEYVEA